MIFVLALWLTACKQEEPVEEEESLVDALLTEPGVEEELEQDNGEEEVPVSIGPSELPPLEE